MLCLFGAYLYNTHKKWFQNFEKKFILTERIKLLFLSLISSVCFCLPAIKRQCVWCPPQNLHAPTGPWTQSCLCVHLFIKSVHGTTARQIKRRLCFSLCRSMGRAWAWNSSWKSRPYRWWVKVFHPTSQKKKSKFNDQRQHQWVLWSSDQFKPEG